MYFLFPKVYYYYYHSYHRFFTYILPIVVFHNQIFHTAGFLNFLKRRCLFCFGMELKVYFFSLGLTLLWRTSQSGQSAPEKRRPHSRRRTCTRRCEDGSPRRWTRTSPKTSEFSTAVPWPPPMRKNWPRSQTSMGFWWAARRWSRISSALLMLGSRWRVYLFFSVYRAILLSHNKVLTH